MKDIDRWTWHHTNDTIVSGWVVTLYLLVATTIVAVVFNDLRTDPVLKVFALLTLMSLVVFVFYMHYLRWSIERQYGFGKHRRHLRGLRAQFEQRLKTIEEITQPAGTADVSGFWG